MQTHIPSLIFFFLPRVPILSQKLSSLSSFLGVTGGRGDFGRGDAMFSALAPSVGELVKHLQLTIRWNKDGKKSGRTCPKKLLWHLKIGRCFARSGRRHIRLAILAIILLAIRRRIRCGLVGSHLNRSLSEQNLLHWPNYLTFLVLHLYEKTIKSKLEYDLFFFINLSFFYLTFAIITIIIKIYLEQKKYQTECNAVTNDTKTPSQSCTSPQLQTEIRI